MLTGGILDFGVALFQWNSATKAMQQGVRLASVSNPVSSDLKTMTGMEGGPLPGDPFPSFMRVCSGASASCSGGSYDAAAMQTIVYGRGETTCGSVAAAQLPACATYSAASRRRTWSSPIGRLAWDLQGVREAQCLP